MGDQVVAAGVEKRGVDVVVQVFEQELIAPLACGSLMVPACIGSIAGSAVASTQDAEVVGHRLVSSLCSSVWRRWLP